MKPLIISIIVLAIFAVIAFLVKQFVIGAARKSPYLKVDSLLTPAELSFFNVLKTVIPDGLCIMCKVRLADLIKVNRSLPRSDSQSAFNRIQSKHVDFVICRSGDMSIHCVVELDDKSHNQPSRQKRDAFVNDALQGAGIQIIHIPVKRSYNTAELQQILTNINDQKNPANLANSKEPEFIQEGNRICSACGAMMILRTAQKGANAGNQFWGCSNYPKCRNIEN
jgi:very-short-patch-repair endonuclease